MQKKKKIVIISGPTSTGKSFLALFLAKLIDGEIINADSMQVYEELKVITSRPPKEYTNDVRHHLYGFLPGDFRYNVYDWCVDCKKIIKDILKKEKTPIIVGGTGLYISTLINGIYDIPKIPEKVKNESSAKLKSQGWEKFYKDILKFDSKSCKKIKNNDSQRIKRIWEVYNYTKIPLSQWQEKPNVTFLDQFNYEMILVMPKRDEIYIKCRDRFYNMINEGAIDEVTTLRDKRYNLTMPIMKAHGVPEIIEYLDGKISLDEAIDHAIKSTRNYVKRQFTWWRGLKIEPYYVFDDFPMNIDLNSIKILKKLTN